MDGRFYVSVGDALNVINMETPGELSVALLGRPGYSLRSIAFDQTGSTLTGVDAQSNALIEVDMVSLRGRSVGALGLTRTDTLAGDRVARVSYATRGVNLYTIDERLGQSRLLAVLERPVAALAFDAASRVLYGFDAAAKTLVRINTDDGVVARVTVVAQLDANITGLAFHAPGTLCGLDATEGRLFEINLQTGVATPTVATEALIGLHSIGFHTASGRLFALDRDGALLAVDRLSGSTVPTDITGISAFSGQ